MGWANSSIRHPNELPDLEEDAEALGVVREDEIEAAFSGKVPPAKHSAYPWMRHYFPFLYGKVSGGVTTACPANLESKS